MNDQKRNREASRRICLSELAYIAQIVLGMLLVIGFVLRLLRADRIWVWLHRSNVDGFFHI